MGTQPCSTSFYFHSVYLLFLTRHLRLVEFSRIFSFESFCGKTMNDEILTIRELAAYLKLTEKTAYRLAANGKLPGFKVGGSWRFRKADLDNWIAVQKYDEGTK